MLLDRPTSLEDIMTRVDVTESAARSLVGDVQNMGDLNVSSTQIDGVRYWMADPKDRRRRRR
jgi:hypothetical protein